jgi:GNAT superfamily N-acetyltransferase
VRTKVKIVDINENTFEQIPRPSNSHFNCRECFYWMEKRDGRTDLVKQKRNWFIRRGRRYDGSLGKVLLWSHREIPVGFIQFGPIAEFNTTRLIYEDRLPVPKGGWCIACVAVKSPFRSKGLASRLIRNTLRDLKRRGVKTVDAYPVDTAHSWNQISVGPVQLWKNCGFEEVAKICYSKGDPVPYLDEITLMRKRW